MSVDVNKKDENLSSDGLSSIDGVLDTLLSAFDIPEEPITPLPPPLILTGARLRLGLSVSSIVSNVVSRQSEAGLPVGDVFADGPNSTQILIKIIVEEIVDALLNEAVVNVVIDPGISVTTIGVGNLGAPVASQGSTTTAGIGNGIIR